MRKFLIHTAACFSALFLSLLTASASGQTLSLNDGSILQSNTNRVGVNIGAIDYWDQGQILKNLIGSSNPGMEPLQQRQIWALTTAGTANTAANRIAEGQKPRLSWYAVRSPAAVPSANVASTAAQ